MHRPGTCASTHICSWHAGIYIAQPLTWEVRMRSNYQYNRVVYDELRSTCSAPIILWHMHDVWVCNIRTIYALCTVDDPSWNSCRAEYYTAGGDSQYERAFLLPAKRLVIVVVDWGDSNNAMFYFSFLFVYFLTAKQCFKQVTSMPCYLEGHNETWLVLQNGSLAREQDRQWLIWITRSQSRTSFNMKNE